MLLGSASKIRSAGGWNRAPPDDGFAALDGRRENLVFKVAMVQPSLLSKSQHLARFAERARQRFLARYTLQWTPARRVRFDDCLHIPQAIEIGPQEPHGVDRLIVFYEFIDRAVSSARSQTACICEPDSRLPQRGCAAIDSCHLDIAYGLQRLQVKLGDEASAE
jgi:hypothetical protein